MKLINAQIILQEINAGQTIEVDQKKRHRNLSMTPVLDGIITMGTPIFLLEWKNPLQNPSDSTHRICSTRSP